MADTFAKMDRMYRLQRYFYDASRKYYLLGRDLLLDELRPAPGENILEVGCGTARNLIILSHKHPEVRFYGVDASREMLLTARRKRRSSDSGNIRLEAALAENFSYRETFGIEVPFDKIFFSYSISMMPEWDRAIDNALANLESGGSLFVVDFYDQRGLPPLFRRALWWWLSKFHVVFWTGLLPYFESLETSGKGSLSVRPIYRRYAFLLTFTKSF